MATNYIKRAPPEMEQDWTDKPGQRPLVRIGKLMATNNTKQKNLLKEVEHTTDIPKPNMSSVYGYNKLDKEWKQLGYKCFDCGKVMSDDNLAQKHPLVCKQTLKINKEEENELLKLVRNYNANKENG